MTVKELIEKLSKVDNDLEVYIMTEAYDALIGIKDILITDDEFIIEI